MNSIACLPFIYSQKKNFTSIRIEVDDLLIETRSSYLDENNKYVFTWTHSYDYPDSLMTEEYDYGKVIYTFSMDPKNY